MAKTKYTMTIERDDLDEVNILIDDNHDVFYNGTLLIDLDLVLNSELMIHPLYLVEKKAILIRYSHGKDEDTNAGLYNYLEGASWDQLKKSKHKSPDLLWKTINLEKVFVQLISTMANKLTCQADHEAIAGAREALLALYDKAADKAKDFTDVPGLEGDDDGSGIWF